MKVVTAVIIDTVSIQKYIFNSNKLKENLGASHIVKSIFLSDLKDTLADLFPGHDEKNFDRWTKCEYGKNPEILLNDEKYEVGYIGGGNALLFFAEKDDATRFMKAFSRRILLNYPGVTLGMAYKNDKSSDDIRNHFGKFSEEMHEALRESKNTYFPNVKIQKYGLTRDCPNSNGAADNDDWEKNMNGKKIYISSISKAKINASKEAQNEKPKGDFEYNLTQQIDHLGQKDGENWVAVVHIDGNNMGLKFRDCDSLNELRYLSRTVKETTEETFNTLRTTLETHLNTNKESVEKIFEISNHELPLRPIVIGGDDVTFVCNAKLALYLTETFINLWVKNMNSNETLKEAGMRFSACGGIVLVKTKYPFFQSYSMAEDLCSRAKLLVKKHMSSESNKEFSSLDFYIHQNSVSGDPNDFIQDHLHFGPYFVGESAEKENHNNVNDLISGINFFEKGNEKKEKWPRSKRKTLRDALNISETNAKKLMGELNARGLVLPYGDDIFIETKTKEKTIKKTPYMDMIEIMEFYPELFRTWRDEDERKHA